MSVCNEGRMSTKQTEKLHMYIHPAQNVAEYIVIYETRTVLLKYVDVTIKCINSTNSLLK